jgi:membrane protease YdiL (CAAX protease family)
VRRIDVLILAPYNFEGKRELNTSEAGPVDGPLNEPHGESTDGPPDIAPAWHTAVLVVFVLGISLAGAYRNPGAADAGKVHRIATYAVTGLFEVALVGWVAFGLRLRRIPLRSLFGAIATDFRSTMQDLGIAIVFWFGSMMALGTAALIWLSVETLITRRTLPIHGGKAVTQDPAQQHAVRAVLQLAPSNGKEIACWILLCLLVGVAEELVFRGYLQRQFIAWARGAVGAGVAFSAIIFGAAHGYEGARSMFLLSLFGVFFGVLALFRRNLRAGIFAHSWHDVFTGLMVSFLHARHLL